MTVSRSQPESDDIVLRLRHLAKLLGLGHFDVPARLNEAADEIERLRAAPQVADTREAAYRETVRQVAAAREKRMAAMRETLEWLDRRGGLGYDAHDRIRDALARSSTGSEP